MRILAAEILDFRNIARTDVRFAPRLTAFVGPNGQGKTNFLEAMYAVAALRPLRNASRRDLVRAGAPRAVVKLTVASARTGLTHTLELTIERGSRTTAKDGKRCEATEFLGVLVAVAFTPDDLEVSKGSPELRRRFLDRALLNSRPAYLERALRYAQAVKARNKLLSRPGIDAQLLDAYDHTLVAAGADVAVARARFVETIAPRIEAYFGEIAAPAPPLRVRYHSSLGLLDDDVAAVRARFLEQLALRRDSDIRRGTTSVGPHLDDLELELDGAPARNRASQGQHRALVLALKLAEIRHLTETIGEPPVLLLDDISSELDVPRSRQLFAALAPHAGQVLLTTTDARQLELVGELEPALRTTYAVDGGRFTARPTAGEATPAEETSAAQYPQPIGLTAKNGEE